MEQTEITAAIRRAIREPKPRTVSDADIVAVTLRAVTIIGIKIVERQPSYFYERESVSSETHVFPYPTGAKKIIKIWDYGGTAITITGAADNGSGLIRITAADHDFSDTAIVMIHDVLGCTEANDTWQIVYVDDDTFDLAGSTFSNTYTSGGKVFQERSGMGEIKLKLLADSALSDENGWYPRKQNIVVDDVGFVNDIIVVYEVMPSTIAQIPDQFHEGLISWPVIDLIDLSDKENENYSDKAAQVRLHERNLALVYDDIARTFKQSSEPSRVRDVWRDDYN